MNTTSSQVRAAALVAILAMAPTSAAVAQHHKGQHAGQQKGAAQHHPKNMADVAQHVAAVKQQAKATQLPTAAAIKNPTGVHPRANVNNQKTSNAAMVTSLHSSITHLNQADHDYNGHRARAMQEINTAIRHLDVRTGQSNTGNTSLAQSGNTTRSGNANGTNAAKGTGTGTVASTGSGTGQKIPQATSDAHLREAQQSLVGLESQMNTSGVNPASFTQAKSSVQSAIRELNLALNDR